MYGYIYGGVDDEAARTIKAEIKLYYFLMAKVNWKKACYLTLAQNFAAQ
jgi:hypothetical protein